MAYIPSFHSKQNPIGRLKDEKVAEEVLLYVFFTAFPVFFLPKKEKKRRRKNLWFLFVFLCQSLNLPQQHHQTCWDFHSSWSCIEWWSHDTWPMTFFWFKFSSYIHIYFFFFLSFGIDTTICTHQEILCLLYAFFLFFFTCRTGWLKYLTKRILVFQPMLI